MLLLLLGCAIIDAIRGLSEEDPVSPCAERSAWWADADGDGFGDPTEVWVTCEQPDGWVDNADDCDDADAAVSSGCSADTAADTADTAGETG